MKTYLIAVLGILLFFFGGCILDSSFIASTVCMVFGIILVVPEYMKFKKELR